MKMKTIEALALSHAIVSAQTCGKFAAPKFGFVLAVNAKALSPFSEAFEKSRIDLATDRAKKGDDGKPLMIEAAGGTRFDIEDIAGFEAALKTISDTEIEVPLMDLTLADFPAEFNPALIAGLLPIIKADQP